VLEGVLQKGVFTVNRVVKQIPGNWKIQWVNPPGFKKESNPRIN
jgi:hypothetical protein